MIDEPTLELMQAFVKLVKVVSDHPDSMREGDVLNKPFCEAVQALERFERYAYALIPPKRNHIMESLKAEARSALPEAGPTENTKSMARRLSAQAGWQDCTRCGAAILNVHPVGKPQSERPKE